MAVRTRNCAARRGRESGSMRRLLLFLASILTLGLAWRFRCLGRHDPIRHPLGGFRCARCGRAGADLEAMGWGAGYVTPSRAVFGRGRNQGITQ